MLAGWWHPAQVNSSLCPALMDLSYFWKSLSNLHQVCCFDCYGFALFMILLPTHTPKYWKTFQPFPFDIQPVWSLLCSLSLFLALSPPLSFLFSQPPQSSSSQHPLVLLHSISHNGLHSVLIPSSSTVLHNLLVLTVGQVSCILQPLLKRAKKPTTFQNYCHDLGLASLVTDCGLVFLIGKMITAPPLPPTAQLMTCIFLCKLVFLGLQV